jgi:serine protease Do
LAVGGFALMSATGAQQKAPPSAPPVVEHAVANANGLSEAFRASSERALPAVVSIHRTGEAKPLARKGMSKRGQMPDELDPLLKRFFEQMPEMQDQGNSQPTQSSGSGVIIDAKGIVLTNNHVVEGGGKITVHLHDGRTFQAEKVMTDPGTDLAVVKLANAHDLPFATLGNSEEMQVGDWVLALGQPFGLQDTVTQGIISATNRGVGIAKHEEFLQTDAAINPGNSGGPLVNLRGEVVGINTAISSTSGGYQGIGFAVPSSVAKWVVPQLLKDGTVHRAFLGVGIQEVDQALADQLKLDRPHGALVTDVQPGSPAADAGLKSQDVIVEFAGSKVSSPRHLQAVVSRSALGSEQPLKVLRDGKIVSLNVHVKERPEHYGETKPTSTEHGEVHGQAVKSLGVEVATLTKDVAATLGINQTEGVVIVSVDEDSPAAKAGLSESQVITQVGRTKVKNVEEFTAAMKGVSLDKGVLLLVRSAEGSRFVVVKD